MMPEYISVSIQTKELISTINTLSTFDEVRDWDARATYQVDVLLQSIHELESEASRLKSDLDQALQERNAKSFFSKVFSTNPQHEFGTAISEIENQKTELESLVDEIQNKVAFTPNDESEKKALLAELRLRKKELTTQKREILATMREIRINARQESASVPYSITGIIGGTKLTAVERRYIRYQKEAALAPHEDQKAAIERQIIETERYILWAERFKK